uniref:Peptidyl-tRNA hydrolase n=1 Tax=candidate division WOR-3 bacterium TaxID=2052148 RepID=A0A7C6EH53_UNCW3
MIIFGLGNPGSNYKWTRHNVGFLFVDSLAGRYKKKFRKFRDYEKAVIEIAQREIKLIKPLLYMNHSGRVVADLVTKQGLRYLPSEEEKKNEGRDFLIVLDDINLPLGRMRFRAKGSDGGHLGLRSVIEALNTDDFLRLRIGIANDDIINRRIDSADFVLSPFSKEERTIIERMIEKGIEGIEIYITQGFEKAQNFINAFKFL